MGILFRFFWWVQCMRLSRCIVHDVPLVDCRGSFDCPICLEEFNRNLYKKPNKSAVE